MKEWAGWCAQQGLPNNAISAPKLGNFLLHLFQVGLSWHTIGIYHSAISAFLEPHCIHKASQRSAISAFNPLASQQCVLFQQGFSSSVCQAVTGATQMPMSRVYQQCLKEWAGWCAQQGLPSNAISAPKLGNFLLHLFQVGLAWHTTGIYRSAISAFLEPHCIHKASNLSFSKLMHHFYLRDPPSHKWFDPWDVEHLLSLVQSWAPTSSLTTLKLA